MVNTKYLPPIMAGVAFTCFVAGGYLEETTAEPKVEYIEVDYWYAREIKTVEYVPVEVEVPVTKTVEVPIRLRNFESVAELEDWLDTDPIMIDAVHLIIKADGMEVWDCDDWAKALKEAARKDGYDLDLQTLYYPYIRHPVKRLSPTKQADHEICSSIIGNQKIFIEPQTYDYWKEARVD